MNRTRLVTERLDLNSIVTYANNETSRLFNGSDSESDDPRNIGYYLASVRYQLSPLFAPLQRKAAFSSVDVATSNLTKR